MNNEMDIIDVEQLDWTKVQGDKITARIKLVDRAGKFFYTDVPILKKNLKPGDFCPECLSSEKGKYFLQLKKLKSGGRGCGPAPGAHNEWHRKEVKNAV